MSAQHAPFVSAEGIWFSIELEAEEFVAFISGQALANLGADETANSRRSVFRRHHEMIDWMARNKFQSGSPRPVSLDAGDFGTHGRYA